MDPNFGIPSHPKNEADLKNSSYFIANISYPIIKLRMVHENAAETLLKAKVLSSKLAFSWKDIKEPKSGQCFLIYMSTKLDSCPPDGIMWPEKEFATKHALADRKTLYVCEKRNGRTNDNSPVRMIKRRYHLECTTDMQIQLLHYLDENDDQKSDTSTKIPPSKQETKTYSNISDASKHTSSIPQNINQNLSAVPAPPKFDNSAHHNIAVAEEDNHYNTSDISRSGNKTYSKKKHMRHMNKVNPREVAPVNNTANPNTVEPPIFGDELDLIALRDVALFRYRRNHENLADLFSPSFTQKTIESLRKPLVPPKYSEILTLRKEKNLSEIKLLKESKPYDKKASSFVYEQINLIRKASPTELLQSKQEVEKRFGEVIDHRKTWRPVSVNYNILQQLESISDAQFATL